VHQQFDQFSPKDLIFLGGQDQLYGSIQAIFRLGRKDQALATRLRKAFRRKIDWRG